MAVLRRTGFALSMVCVMYVRAALKYIRFWWLFSLPKVLSPDFSRGFGTLASHPVPYQQQAPRRAFQLLQPLEGGV